MTLTPVNGLAGNIQLSCQGAPAGTNCTVTPSMVSLAANYPAQITVAVATIGRSMGAPRGGPPVRRWGPGPSGRLWLELATLLALLGLAGWAAARRRAGALLPGLAYRRLRLSGLVLAALMLLLMAWAACGGGGGMGSSGVANPGTPAGTYALTVTGVYQSPAGQPTGLTRTQQVTLQVN
jgi:hypothetical protein